MVSESQSLKDLGACLQPSLHGCDNRQGAFASQPHPKALRETVSRSYQNTFRNKMGSQCIQSTPNILDALLFIYNVWVRSAHTKKIGALLYEACRTITESLRPHTCQYYAQAGSPPATRRQPISKTE